MKKIFLFFAVALFVGCVDYTDDFNAIDERLDKLEQAVPSIEEQIESINAQLTSLKATDEAIKAQIAELEKSNNATATEIADLKKKDSALEKSIGDLQKYVDTQIANAKSEAAAAYATVEQYNTIVAQLNALQSSTSKLGEELTAKINAEVKSLTDKIAELEARLKAVEEKVENLLARIQSVSYLPEYSDEVATIHYLGDLSEITLDFKVSPKECAAELAKVWQTAVSCEALYTKTRAVSLVEMPAICFELDAERGVITIVASGENLSEEFFAGTQEAKVALVISDGNSSVTSEYIPMVAKEITNEIWCTTTDGNIVTPHSEDEVTEFRTIKEIFGASLVSNTYENGVGKMIFDGPVTVIRHGAFNSIETLKTITLPNGIQSLGEKTFQYCHALESIKLPDNLTAIYAYAFHQCDALTELTIPDSVTSIGTQAFFNCRNLQYIYSKFSTPDNMTLVVNGVLRWVSRCYPAGDYKIPEGVTKIGDHAIGYPNNVITVTIPESVETCGNKPIIGAYNISAFYGKYTVDNLHFIKDEILYSAAVHGLTEYEVPEGVKGTGNRIFRTCKLTKVTLPASLENIGDNIFENCEKLQGVYCKAIVPPAQGEDYDIFVFCSNIPTIYVPRVSVEAYKTATGWSQYADKIVGYDF